MILRKNWDSWHALSIFFLASSRSDFKIEYVAFTLLTRGNSESDESLNRFWIALKRKMTKKDNKALKSDLFITKFTKNLGLNVH